MFDYDKDASKAVEILKDFDFTNDIERYHHNDYDPYDIITLLSIKYGEIVSKAIECLTTDEFIMYLEEKYKVVFVEETHYRML